MVGCISRSPPYNGVSEDESDDDENMSDSGNMSKDNPADKADVDSDAVATVQ